MEEAEEADEVEEDEEDEEAPKGKAELMMKENRKTNFQNAIEMI